MLSPKRFLEKYIFSSDLALEVKLANIVYMVGFFASIFTGIFRIFIGGDVSLILIIFVISLTVLVLAYLANRFKLHQCGRLIVVCTLAFVLFPMAFFAMGGVTSAMPAYFVLSIVVIFLLTWGKIRIVFLLLHCAAVFALYFWGTGPFLSRFIKEDPSGAVMSAIQTIISVGFCIGFIAAFQNHIYLLEQERGNSIRNDLALRTKLLGVVNQVSEILLHIEADPREILGSAMEILARCIGADRMFIWKNALKDGKLHYVQEYEWLDGDTGKSIKDSSYSYLDTIPAWKAKFESGSCVNGPLKNLSEGEQKILAPFGIVSILVIPVFLQEKFWGFVSFDDCRNERNFSTDEISILRSGSLLLANAINRHQNEGLLEYQLKQQELMSDISQNFISGVSLEESVRTALSRTGQFLDTNRVMVIVSDEDMDESYPLFSWFSGEAWRPREVYTGFTKLINNTFPLYMAVKGLVPLVHCDDIHNFEEGAYKGLSRIDVRSFIWVPIYVDNTFWGLLTVEQCDKIRSWSESDSQLIAMVSSAISGAVSRDLMDKERSAALDQALQASFAKSNFLSNMSHEMRTPMNAIIGMTTIGKNAANTERKDYAFNKIEDASTHLLGVINDILDMSKIEANKLELSPALFSFEKMLQKAVNVINFKVTEKAQSFHVTIDKGIPRELIGDDQRLAQVITNLLSNAVKFTPEEGSIRLNAHLAETKQKGADSDDVEIQVEVSDTGIGISDDQQARLFHSFEQAESSTTRKFGGTGLGLAISKRIVELMGGKIWIESELEKGSAFIFTVHLKKSHTKFHSALTDGVNWSNVRLLAVDDEKEVRDYFADIASRFDIKCDTAADGDEALRIIAEKGDYDIYFIDWRLPGLDGVALTKKIKEGNTHRSVITMFSAASLTEIEDEARAAGVDAFLSKPLFPSDIADLINQCLGTHGAKVETVHKSQDDHFEGNCILLVEDVEINREIVQALLEPMGLKIECAENGEEAVRMVSENSGRYDMIFMDVQMPKMDGYEATRQIKALPFAKAASIPIVAMTANVFRGDIEKALAAGMNDHIGKPLDLADVLQKLHKYLPRSGSTDAHVIKYGETGDEEEKWKDGLAWTPDLETGNKVIDDQHKQIFRLTSNLIDACKKGRGHEMVGETLEFLANYTIHHFADEEDLQIRSGFPLYEEHKKLHEDFKKTVAGLIEEYNKSGAIGGLAEKINSAIVRWLVNHIQKEDAKIGKYINNNPAAGGLLDTNPSR